MPTGLLKEAEGQSWSKGRLRGPMEMGETDGSALFNSRYPLETEKREEMKRAA